MKKIFMLFYLPSLAFGQFDLIINPSVISPLDGCELSSTESLVIQVENVQPTPYAGDFEIGYQLNAGTPVIENMTISLPGNGTYIYFFLSTLDLAACQIHDLDIWVYDINDINNSNDTISIQIISDCSPTFGTFSGDSVLCSYADTVYHTGYTGVIEEWLWSHDNGVTWNSFLSSSDTFDTPPPDQQTDVRVVIGSPFGLCPDDTSGVFNAHVWIGPSSADAGLDTTIICGDTIQLFGSGAATCGWAFQPTMSNNLICDPFVWPDTTTTYYLTVYDSNNCSTSEWVTITVDCPSGIIENTLKLHIPSFVKRSEYWKINGILNYPINKLSVYNLQGQLIFISQSYQNNWRPSNVKSGIYLYNLKIENQVFSGKIVIGN